MVYFRIFRVEIFYPDFTLKKHGTSFLKLCDSGVKREIWFQKKLTGNAGKYLLRGYQCSKPWYPCQDPCAALDFIPVSQLDVIP